MRGKKLLTILIITLVIGSFLVSAKTIEKIDITSKDKDCNCNDLEYSTDIETYRGFLEAAPEALSCMCGIGAKLVDKLGDTIVFLGGIDIVDLVYWQGKYVEISGNWQECIEWCNGKVIILSITEIDICGDLNNDETVNIVDLTYMVSYLFGGGPAPIPDVCIADLNGDGEVNIVDLTYFVSYLFVCGIEPIEWCCMEIQHEETTGECTSYEEGDNNGHMELEVIGNDLYIHHIDAYYQCCLEYFVDYELEWENQMWHLTGYEADFGEPCDCICYFNLTSTVYDLENGDYLVTLIGIYGDTIGEEIITI